MDVGDWVVPSVDDIAGLQYLAANSMQYLFVPSLMDLPHHPHVYPLTELSKSTGAFSLVCISHVHAACVVKELKALQDASPLSSYCVVVRMSRMLDNTLFKGWTVLTEWSKGHKFHMPGRDDVRRCEQRVRAYYLPVKSDALCHMSESDSAFMTFPGKVNGRQARVLFDSGATASFLSVGFARQLGISGMGEPKTIQLGDRYGTGTTEGDMIVTVRLANCNTRWHCHVFDLHPSYDLILGQDWHLAFKADLRYSDGSVVMRKGKRTVTLRKEMTTERSVPKLLSVMQLKRELKQGCQPMLVLLQKVEEPAQTEFPAQMQELGKEFADVFQPTPAGLPPVRDVGHTIPLEPGGKPPFRPLYRLSPLEYEEAKRQITEYLAKGWIEPSSSPFGAPILFVPKKNGQLRMCVDYRALNKVTVKDRYPLPRIDDLFDRLSKARLFSSLDLAQGYHQIRVTAEDVPKTAFRTPFGHYQWRVLSFGLTNAPATFQRLMNNVFKDYLDDFVLVYLDDILIFSKDEEEHKEHLRKVLTVLREHKLFAQPAKCSFFTKEISYLGHLVGEGGLRVDPHKVAAVKDWAVPQDVHQLRSFLGLTNYFRKFLEGYSTIVAPLTSLTKKTEQWKWTQECQRAFEAVKKLLITAPVLALPDPDKAYVVTTDASDYGIGGVLTQEDHPVAFASRKLSPAELNYTTSEKEMLAVVYALMEWRCYLEGKLFTVITDHNPNIYFHTQQHLSRRQARWSELISSFTFDFQYRPGRTNVADSLSRNPVDPAPQEELSTLMVLQRRRQSGRDTIASRIHEGYQHDPWFKDPQNLANLTQDEYGMWHRKEDKAVIVPNYKDVRRDILYELHNTKYCGHLGVKKTRARVQHRYWWPTWGRDVDLYVRKCDTCVRNKSSSSVPAGLLQPLPIPEEPWEAISMDYITHLPETRRGHDAILVFVDRLSKMVHFAATTSDVGAEGTAKLFLEHVFKHHGMPQCIVSDRDARFTSRFWRQLMEALGTKLHLSTAFHPQTDGQTERVNRTLEQMLRMFVSPTQDDWDDLLPALEFACNSSVHESTGQVPFVMCTGRLPRTPLERSGWVAIPSVNDFVGAKRQAIARAKECLRKAQQRQKSYADKHRREETFAVGDKVLLSTKNLQLNSPGARKLLPRYIGPFEVLQRVGEVAYKLALPEHMRVHNVFHVSLLARYTAEGTYQPPPPVLRDGHLEYEVEQVLYHRPVRAGRQNSYEYLIKWKGYPVHENTWEPAQNIPESLQKEYWEDQAKRAQRLAAKGVQQSRKKRA